MSYGIVDIACYLPERVVDNDFLASQCGIDRAFLDHKVGILERRFAGEDEPPSVMAHRSAQILMDRGSATARQVDVLIVCTQNPDYRLPPTACLVHEMLGLEKSVLAFDMNLGCSGFVCALPVAGNFINQGSARSALVIMVDQYSRIVDPGDRNTASLFGDAAAAALLGPCEEGYGVLDGIFGTDGSGAKHLILYNSGVRKEAGKPPHLFMDGREIFKFSVTVVPDSVRQLMARHGLSVKDVRHFVFHQANLYLLREIQKRLEIGDDQMVVDLADCGNTVSASIPLAYQRLLAVRPPARGDLVVFCGFGVGLSWGTVLYRCC